MNRLIPAFLISLLLVTTPGCLWLIAGAAAGAGGAAYHMGKLRETVNKPVPTVQAAARKAMKDLKLPATRDVRDQLTAELKSEFSDGKGVWISIKSLTEKSSQLTIRVGLAGDPGRSRLILDEIKKHL